YPPGALGSRQGSDPDHSYCVVGSAATRAHTAKSRCGSLSAGRTQVLSRRNAMSMKQTFYRSVAVIGLAGLLGATPAQLNAQSTVAINNDDIGGVVTARTGRR